MNEKLYCSGECCGTCASYSQHGERNIFVCLNGSSEHVLDTTDSKFVCEYWEEK